ncbi:MAG: sporulation initiation factor Spo0A C-terminal domain-containing protein [Firmicutes bacterium]|nr:sporulation initiation factor Spo0A C-terminal domain-containing protein [Bacillota bacterium]
MQNHVRAVGVLSGFNKRLDERIGNIFLTIGIPANIKGYTFMREGIKMIVANKGLGGGITKELYPAIAARFSTSASKVERAIRHAIEVGFSRGRIDKVNEIFRVTAFSPKDKPTNGEFLAFLAEKMMLEYYDELAEAGEAYSEAI